MDPRCVRLIDHLRATGMAQGAVLDAMAAVPRERFIPSVLADQAYEDKALPIARGQTISQPSVVALMTQALELGDRAQTVLEIGTGSGYQTAVLAGLARRVYTIERHRPLADLSHAMFDTLRLKNITAIVGDGMKGWPVAGVSPFDRIIVTAAAPGKVPSALVDQLAVGGIMIIPVGADPDSQVLRRIKRESDDITSSRDLMAVRFVPLLPEVADDAQVA